MSEVYFIGDNIELTLRSDRCVAGRVTGILPLTNRVRVSDGVHSLYDKEYPTCWFVNCVDIGKDDGEECLFVEGVK